jgi:translation initiation factor IF-2
LPDPVAGQTTSTLLTQVEELRKWQHAAKMDTVALDEAVCLMSGPPKRSPQALAGEGDPVAPAATEEVAASTAPSAPVSSAEQQSGTATCPEVPASQAACDDASDEEKAADQTPPSVATPAPQAQVQAATEEDATLAAEHAAKLVAEAAAPTEAKAPAVALAPKSSAGLGAFPKAVPQGPKLVRPPAGLARLPAPPPAPPASRGYASQRW